MSIYEKMCEYKKRHPKTIAWRLEKHSEVVEGYLNPGEEVSYVFCGQKNDKWYDIFSTSVIALTNKRLLIGQKRVMFGSILTQITPDLYNDMKVYKGLFFGKITIDTVKEEIVLTNIAKDALQEIETNVSEFMMNAKQKYKNYDE